MLKGQLKKKKKFFTLLSVLSVGLSYLSPGLMDLRLDDMSFSV